MKYTSKFKTCPHTGKRMFEWFLTAETDADKELVGKLRQAVGKGDGEPTQGFGSTAFDNDPPEGGKS